MKTLNSAMRILVGSLKFNGILKTSVAINAIVPIMVIIHPVFPDISSSASCEFVLKIAARFPVFEEVLSTLRI